MHHKVANYKILYEGYALKYWLIWELNAPASEWYVQLRYTISDEFYAVIATMIPLQERAIRLDGIQFFLIILVFRIDKD